MLGGVARLRLPWLAEVGELLARQHSALWPRVVSGPASPAHRVNCRLLQVRRGDQRGYVENLETKQNP